jgi:hypothetical protein
MKALYWKGIGSEYVSLAHENFEILDVTSSKDCQQGLLLHAKGYNYCESSKEARLDQKDITLCLFGL